MRCVWILLLLAFVSAQARYAREESSELENSFMREGGSLLESSENGVALDELRFKRDLDSVQGNTNDDVVAVDGDNTNEHDAPATRRPHRRRGGNRRQRCRPGENSRRCNSNSSRRQRKRRPTPAPAAPISDPEIIV